MSAVAEREMHRNMILNPFKWPLMWLPLKNREARDNTGFPECGIIRGSNPDGSITVYMTTLYAPNLKDCEKREFQDVDALLDAGWVVD